MLDPVAWLTMFLAGVAAWDVLSRRVEETRFQAWAEKTREAMRLGQKDPTGTYRSAFRVPPAQRRWAARLVAEKRAMWVYSEGMDVIALPHVGASSV